MWRWRVGSQSKYVVGRTHIVQVQEFATLSQLSPTHGSQFTIHNCRLTIYSLYFTIYNLQFTTHGSQCTVYIFQFTIHNSQLLVTHVSHNPWLMADCDCPLSDPSGSSIMLLIHRPLGPSPGTSYQTPLANPGGPTCHPGPWDPGW